MIIRAPFPSSVKNIRILDGVALNLHIVFSNTCIFLTFILSIRERSRPSYPLLFSFSFSAIITLKIYRRMSSSSLVRFIPCIFEAVVSGIFPL